MENKIAELYEKLNIPKSIWPEYKDPYDYAKQFEKCSATTNVTTSASGSSSARVEVQNKTPKTVFPSNL